MPLTPYPNPSESCFGPQIPACFTTLEQARDSLLYHKSRCRQTALDIDNVAEHATSFEEYSQNVNAVLEKWASAFQALVAKEGANFDFKAVQGAAVLKISQLTSMLHTKDRGEAKLRNQSNWDNNRAECEKIVDLAGTVLELQKNNNHGTAGSGAMRSPVFSLDMSTVAPLFAIAHRCRDPCIRRRVIALLYDAPRQEGLFHSVLAARICEKIMTIEEAGCEVLKKAEDVPEWKRISDVDVKFDLQRREGFMRFSRRRDTGQQDGSLECVMEIVREEIEW